MQGFQLWVNLPASEKMRAPAYQEFPVNDIPVERLENGTVIRVIAGKSNQGIQGPINNNYVNPIYMDITLPTGQQFEQTLNTSDNAFIYVIDGQLSVGKLQQTLTYKEMGILGNGDQVSVVAEESSRFLLIAAQPLNEPVARGGPFVMNTKAEVLQAFEDFQNNRF